MEPETIDAAVFFVNRAEIFPPAGNAHRVFRDEKRLQKPFGLPAGKHDGTEFL